MNDCIYKRPEVTINGEKKALDLFTLPLISRFRLLLFSGETNGTALTNRFDINDIQGRIMIIKSLKIVPYYINASEDFFLDDGVTQSSETIPAGARINRIFDRFINDANMTVFINGGLWECFQNDGSTLSYPLDLDLDNIFYKIPEAIQTIQITIDTNVFTDLQASTFGPANVKVMMGVYLI